MNIFVGNLNFEVTEAELENAFTQYGNVNSVNIVKDRETGRSRGFGFVEMQNKDDGVAAIEGLNMTKIGGRAVNVNEARPREKSGGRSGGWERR